MASGEVRLVWPPWFDKLTTSGQTTSPHSTQQ
jgi:hypothetical protein